MTFSVRHRSIFVFFSLLVAGSLFPQLSYDAAACYGLRKLNPSWNGSAIQVRRTCDNGTGDIGFTNCGDLDTTALKTFVIASNPLSAITGTAAAAYSLRRLNCTYAGSAIRVRSSALGSPTLDIGFTTNGDLDTAALKTFIGSNNGFVTIWYDQTGNNRHASQATAGSQPRIVNAGVIERQQQRPAVYWLGNGCSLATAPFTAYISAACFNAVAKVNVDVTYNTIVNKTTANYPAPLDLYNSQMVIGNGSAYNFYPYGQTFNAAKPLSVWTYEAASGGNYNFYYNGTSSGSGAVGVYGDNGNALILGSRTDGVTGLNGWISEVITFAAIPSSTDRQFVEWSQSQYYSISGIALGALPVAPASASITIWYDQSGAGKDAVQATAANQPRIVNTGLIEKNGTAPAIYFGGLPRNLVAPLSTSVYPVSVSLLANTSGSATAGAFYKHGNSSSGSQGGIALGIGNSGGDYNTNGTSVISLKEWSSWCPSSPNVNYPAVPFVSSHIQQASGAVNTYLNGTNVPLANSASSVDATTIGNLFIGGYTNVTNRYPVVKESELGIFPVLFSVTRRTLMESNQAAYYNVTISNNKYVVPAVGSYHRFVNGVGRENTTDSVSGTRNTVGMGFVIGQAATDFLKDNGDYIMAGINCRTPGSSTLNLPGGITDRWTNDWYIYKTDVGNNSGNLTIYFDFGDYSQTGLPGVAANYELLRRTSPSGNFTIVTGTTKTVSGDRVRFTVNASQINTNEYYTIGTSNNSASPLPITLISFSAECDRNTTHLSWSTASEKNNAYFSIERSADGTNFETISKQSGAGNSTEKRAYSFEDPQTPTGISYYRLSAVDRDHSASGSWLSVISCGLSVTGAIELYPNPTSSDLFILGSEPFVHLSILNSAGQELFSEKHFDVSKPISVQTYPAGLYLIRIREVRGTVTKKLVVQGSD